MGASQRFSSRLAGECSAAVRSVYRAPGRSPEVRPEARAVDEAGGRRAASTCWDRPERWILQAAGRAMGVAFGGVAGVAVVGPPPSGGTHERRR